MTDPGVPSELQEVLEYYDEIVSRAPLDDTEWDFVMTAAEYRLLRAQVAQAGDQQQCAPRQWTSEMAHAGHEVHKHQDIQCAECGAIWVAMWDRWSKTRLPEHDRLAQVARMRPVFNAAMRWYSGVMRRSCKTPVTITNELAPLDRACDRAARKAKEKR